MLILSIFTLGCQGSRKIDPFQEALQKSDSGDYTGAIAELEELQTTNPSSRVKIALASAYAARGGLVIANFWEFVKAMRGPAVTADNLQTQPFYVHNEKNLDVIAAIIPADTKQNIDQLLLSMAAMQVYRERLGLYPYIKKDGRGDLSRAVDVLGTTADPGARIYRVIVNSVIVRSELDDGFNFWNSVDNQFQDLLQHPLEFGRILCSPVTGSLTDWLSHQFDRAKLISADLAISFPSQAVQYTTLAEPVQVYQARLPELQLKLIPQGCPQ